MAGAEGPDAGDWVRELRPDTSHIPDPVCLPETLHTARTRVGEGPVAWAVQLGHRVALYNIEADPVFGGSEAAVVTKRLGPESVALHMLIALDAGKVEQDGLPAEADRQMREFVHRRISLDQVWASIRVGHGLLAESFIEACRMLVPVERQPEQLAQVSRLLMTYVDGFARGASETYRQEERAWLSSANAARDETVRALLHGAPVDVGAASRTLGYRLEGRLHLALVLQHATPGRADATALHRAASVAIDAIGGTAGLVMPVGRTAVWAWCALAGGTQHPLVDGRLARPGTLIFLGGPGRAPYSSGRRELCLTEDDLWLRDIPEARLWARRLGRRRNGNVSARSSIGVVHGSVYVRLDAPPRTCRLRGRDERRRLARWRRRRRGHGVSEWVEQLQLPSGRGWWVSSRRWAPPG